MWLWTLRAECWLAISREPSLCVVSLDSFRGFKCYCAAWEGPLELDHVNTRLYMYGLAVLQHSTNVTGSVSSRSVGNVYNTLERGSKAMYKYRVVACLVGPGVGMDSVLVNIH